ncbi:hypothetical protein [Staphylococcus phage vB_SepM_ phiIPLA-C1C]|uniref:Uncharacterized protein n=5 Tax=Sepunavirus TaxID=1980928 RepID=W5R9K8_9CAUD|nr:hypothetical protein [Clostridium sp.]YP_009214603.1 hypothetical protein AVU40_gp148 [Staphylococcus phage phiIPLA-C1C]YP_009601067.1 hypothetical protein FDH45_gp142 [Staphylococcus phage phiIBB-SEP1]AXY83897.1 hypothetical protein Terranova_014 [Staphylococcus phage Terranova]QLF86747.1 hypothetical protein BESEP4_00013 [Staphylococcus phage vB_SepM_BE04]QLF87135.1 hypothetical protein BESEP5_00193 [Staphylococcus phage vB_SepM_BE05]QLF87193.1 hypothetical protein BESEP6_00185 [Staphylo
MKNVKNLKNWLKRNDYDFEEYNTPDGCGSTLKGIIIHNIEFATENDELVALFPDGDYEHMTNRQAYNFIRKNI